MYIRFWKKISKNWWRVPVSLGPENVLEFCLRGLGREMLNPAIHKADVKKMNFHPWTKISKELTTEGKGRIIIEDGTLGKEILIPSEKKLGFGLMA